MDFCKCGSIIQDGICTNIHCMTRNEAVSSWIINGKLERFKKPVMLAEAQEAVRNKSEIIINIKPPKKQIYKNAYMVR